MYNRVISYLYYSKILFPSGFIVNIEIIRSSIADLIYRRYYIKKGKSIPCLCPDITRKLCYKSASFNAKPQNNVARINNPDAEHSSKLYIRV